MMGFARSKIKDAWNCFFCWFSRNEFKRLLFKSLISSVSKCCKIALHCPPSLCWLSYLFFFSFSSPLTTDWLITCSHLFVHFSLRLWSLTYIDSPVPSSMNIKHALDCQELCCTDILFAKKFAKLTQINSNSNTPRNQNVKWNIFQYLSWRRVFMLTIIDQSQSLS